MGKVNEPDMKIHIFSICRDPRKRDEIKTTEDQLSKKYPNNSKKAFVKEIDLEDADDIKAAFKNLI